MPKTAAVLAFALLACGPGPAGVDGGDDAAAARDAPLDARGDAFGGDAARDDAPAGCRYGSGCDLRAQDCGSGRACVPGLAASVCIRAGAGMVGDTCATVEDCGPGLLCLIDGHCAQIACARDDCTVPSWVYVALTDDAGHPLPNGVGYCQDEGDCTPVPNDCPAGQTCWPAQTGGDSSRCETAGSAAEGASCAAGVSCARDLICAGAPPTCVRPCRIGMDTDCTGAATTCTGVGWPTYGVCR